MGLIVPAPFPHAERLSSIIPRSTIVVGAGIWAFGLLLYTIFVRVSVPVLAGELTYDKRVGESVPMGLAKE